MYLSDQNSAQFFHPQKFAIEGPPLKSSVAQPGWKNFKVKVIEDIHLEDDPHYPCRSYQYIGEYQQCLEKEYTKQSMNLLNCTPPWMTNNQDVWCQDPINGSVELRDKTRFLFGKMSFYNGFSI